ncbi:MAG: hypothetical protein SFW67_11140 [Myxococcaceae bacterium]|nr:hypothetical protein [Myxococcaceae bacterium]
MNRRAVLRGGLAVAVVSQSCASGWSRVIEERWRPARVDSSERREVVLELVRLATLAGNSHNSQPWRFVVRGDGIRIEPDWTRRLPVVDPDDHHLWVSLGCAAQNLVEAAPAFGLAANVTLGQGGAPAVDVRLEPGPSGQPERASAITRRGCRRSVYDGRPVPAPDLERLRSAASLDGVAVEVVPRETTLSKLLPLFLEASTAQAESAAFRDELKAWLRFNEASATEQGDGLFSASTGNPTAPTFIGRLAFGGAFTPASESRKLTEQLESSAGLVVFTGASESVADWVTVGRAVQRFALEATLLDVAHAHVNQPVEVAAVRPRFASALGQEGRRPDLVLRFGYGPSLARSMRRPVESVTTLEPT